MDYLNLFRDFGVTLQTGGSDQWGNITAGAELIRRVEGARVHALATPLVTKADGTKFGKTESGTVWLDAEMTSPYAFYQFWLNSDDRDVVDLLKYYTFRSREEIEELARQTEEEPFRRAAQRALADDVTTLVHGHEETERIKAAAAALFGGGDLTDLSPETLGAALREAGSVQVKRADGLPTVVDLLVETGLSASKRRRAPHRGGGRRLPEQPPGGEPRPRSVGGRPHRRELAGPAPRQEEPGRRRGRRLGVSWGFRASAGAALDTVRPVTVPRFAHPQTST